MSTAWRWTAIVAAVVLVLAITVAVSIAMVVSALPFEQATLVIDGERVELPPLKGVQAVLALAMALLAVILAGLIAIAIAVVAAAMGVVVAGIVVLATMLLVATPALLVGWIVWRLIRRPAKPATGRAVAPA